MLLYDGITLIKESDSASCISNSLPPTFSNFLSFLTLFHGFISATESKIQCSGVEFSRQLNHFLS